MIRLRKVLASAGVAALGIAILAGTGIVKAGNNKETVIAEGVFIGNVNVGGMTADEAKDAVSDYVDALMDTTFTLNGVESSIEASAKEMGVTSDTDAAVEEALQYTHTGNLIDRYKQTIDLKKENKVVNMRLQVDKQETANIIYSQVDKLNSEAEDNSLKIENDNFTFVPGKAGVEVDIVNSVYAIDNFLANEWDTKNNNIELVTNEIEPRGSEEELSQMRDVLGEFSTDFSSSAAGRATNVANACSKINGHLLYPGEEFSVADAISPITMENGYQLAHAYQNGQVVDSVGGGVCQVATTLYNAVIRAELDVTMRYNHSMTVGYVPYSADAAIAVGSSKDFKFKNNLDHPVYLFGACYGRTLNFKVYGVETRDPNRVVKFRSETLSTKDPEAKFVFSSDFDLGYIASESGSSKGVVARLWKEVYEGDKLVSSDIFNNSNYSPSSKVVTVGIRGASAEQVAAIKAAAGSGEDAVRGAVSAAKAAKEQAEKEKEEKEKEKEDAKAEENKKPEKTDDANTGNSSEKTDGAGNGGDKDNGNSGEEGLDDV